MLDVVLVDHVELHDRRLAAAVVRRRVEALVRAALRERAARGVAARLERDHARHVRLQREHLKVEHQLHVLVERIGHADRRLGQLARLAATSCALRPPGCGARSRGCPSTYLSRRCAVRRPELALQLRHLARDPVEDALVRLAARHAVRVVRAGAEQHVERDARIADHRQRLARARPADRVGVRAAVVVVAAAGLVEVLDAELHRRHRAVLSDAARDDLVDRRADVEVGPLRLLRVRLREERRARAEVVAADLGRRERFGHAHVGVADDGQVLAPRLERA